MDKIDLEINLSGVQAVLGILRDYYGGTAAFLQDEQFAKLENQAKSDGAVGDIISLSKFEESDFSGTLAKIETEEADAIFEYETTTQQNRDSRHGRYMACYLTSRGVPSRRM